LIWLEDILKKLIYSKIMHLIKFQKNKISIIFKKIN
jgi:hypothetical protein